MKAKTLRTLREITVSLIAIAMLAFLLYPTLLGDMVKWYIHLLMISIGLIIIIAPKPIISNSISHQ